MVDGLEKILRTDNYGWCLMKINYTMLSPGKTGGPIVLANIINRLSERGHQVSVTMPRGRFDLLSKEITQITPVNLSNKFSFFIARTISAFSRHALKKEIFLNLYRELDLIEEITPECDINVATYHLTAFPVFRSKKGIQFYHMQHYEVFFSSEPHRRALAEETYYLPLKKIANSIWLKSQIKKLVGEDVPIVNPGIDHNVFKPRANKIRNIKRVVCYGDNREWKGFQDVLEAMKLVFRKRKDVEWIVFGLSPLKYQSPEAPYQFIEGIFNEKLAELYSSAHVVICPSWYESFPLPPLEAMACGTPLVTTRIGTEDYCSHEVNSLVVPARDPKVMAEAILKLLEEENMALRFIQKGLETAQQFTWEQAVGKVERLFKSALVN